MQLYVVRWTDCRTPEENEILQTEFFIHNRDAAFRVSQIEKIKERNEDVFMGKPFVRIIEWGNLSQLVEALNSLNKAISKDKV